MSGIILYWVTAILLNKKNNSVLKYEIKTINKRLTNSSKLLKLETITKNNFDLHPKIFKLFFVALWFDIFLLALNVVANFIYTSIFFYNVFGCQISGVNIHWNWIGTVIINGLFGIFLVWLMSDYYKLSLRGSKRNNYSKLFFLDLLTCNILSTIGNLIFILNKSWMLKENEIQEIKFQNSENFQKIQNYFKLIFKIELLTFLTNLILFCLSLLIGYFVPVNAVKLVCLVVVVWNIVLLYGWIIPRVIAVTILHKMLQNLLKNHSSWDILTITRFLGFFGYYYIAIFITSLKFDDYNAKEYILENW